MSQPIDTTTNETRLIAFGDVLIQLHNGFRRDLARIRDDVDRVLDGAQPTAPALPRDLRTHCLSFCEQLHHHHTEEDGIFFPYIAREHPELAAVLDRLRSEHRVIALGLNDLQAVLADLGSVDPADTTRSAALRKDVERIANTLEAHLDYEEQQLVPVLNAMTTLPDGV